MVCSHDNNTLRLICTVTSCWTHYDQVSQNNLKFGKSADLLTKSQSGFSSLWFHGSQNNSPFTLDHCMITLVIPAPTLATAMEKFETRDHLRPLILDFSSSALKYN